MRLSAVKLCVFGLLIAAHWSAASDLTRSRFNLDDFISESERAYLDKKQVIRKCVDPHWMPLEGINSADQHVGVIADILELIEQRIGVPFQLVPTEDWVESLEKLRMGECDLVTSDTLLGDEPSGYIKTIPFMNHRSVYITRDTEPLQLDFSLIADQPIGVPKGYPTIELIKNHYGDVNIIEVRDVDEGILKVSRGELYAFTDLLPICSYSIQKQGLTNLKVAGHLDIELPVVMDVRADQPELASILNSALSRLEPAMVNQFLSRWLKVEYDMKWDWHKSVGYGSFALLVLAIILYWNRKLLSLNRKLDKANAELALLNETDTLTKLKNRNFLDNKLPGYISLAGRNKLSLGVALFDLDHFKRLNDKYGHSMGDRCLVRFAEKLRAVFRRESDYAVRFGGEEFALICVGMSEESFVEAIEHLREEVENLVLKDASGEEVRFTVSAGYVFYPISPEIWQEKLIYEADEYLYQAKTSGRNRVSGARAQETWKENLPPQ